MQGPRTLWLTVEANASELMTKTVVYSVFFSAFSGSLEPRFMFIALPQALRFRRDSVLKVFFFFFKKEKVFLKEIFQFIFEKWIWWLELISSSLKWQTTNTWVKGETDLVKDRGIPSDSPRPCHILTKKSNCVDFHYFLPNETQHDT